MYHVYGLGNALVDEEYRVEDSFLTSHKIDKGHMTLVEEERLDALVAALSHAEPKRVGGGSAANTITAVQALGGATFYSCRVADDATGQFFLKDLSDLGVTLNDNASAAQGTSGRCLIMITDDAERSMNTFLGISTDLAESNINEAALRNSDYYYVEGYLSSSPTAMAAAITCREIAEQHNTKVAVCLSDPSMVEFFGDNLRNILGNGVDQLFCNEEEALSFTGTDRLDIAVTELSDISREVNVTLGPHGSIYTNGHKRIETAGFKVKAIDTNGAGDIYAGACLYGLCHAMEPAHAAHLANFAAATLVQQYGARLSSAADYKALLKNLPSA